MELEAVELENNSLKVTLLLDTLTPTFYFAPRLTLKPERHCKLASLQE